MAWAKTKGVKLVVFPAGYLTAETGYARKAASSVLRSAKRLGLALLLGVDETGSAPKNREKGCNCKVDRSASALPFFVLAWAPGLPRTKVWRQRAVSNRHALRSLNPEEAQVNAIHVGLANVGVVACGEGFSREVQERLAAAKPDVVAMLAHTAAGSRHWQALDRLARMGLPNVRAVHADVAQNLLRTRGRRVSPLKENDLPGNGICTPGRFHIP
jgi:hypothetical protein